MCSRIGHNDRRWSHVTRIIVTEVFVCRGPPAQGACARRYMDRRCGGPARFPRKALRRNRRRRRPCLGRSVRAQHPRPGERLAAVRQRPGPILIVYNVRASHTQCRQPLPPPTTTTTTTTIRTR